MGADARLRWAMYSEPLETRQHLRRQLAQPKQHIWSSSPDPLPGHPTRLRGRGHRRRSSILGIGGCSLASFVEHEIMATQPLPSFPRAIARICAVMATRLRYMFIATRISKAFNHRDRQKQDRHFSEGRYRKRLS